MWHIYFIIVTCWNLEYLRHILWKVCLYAIKHFTVVVNRPRNTIVRRGLYHLIKMGGIVWCDILIVMIILSVVIFKLCVFRLYVHSYTITIKKNCAIIKITEAEWYSPSYLSSSLSLLSACALQFPVKRWCRREPWRPLR